MSSTIFVGDTELPELGAKSAGIEIGHGGDALGTGDAATGRLEHGGEIADHDSARLRLGHPLSDEETGVGCLHVPHDLGSDTQA